MRDRYYTNDEARRLAEELKALLRGWGITVRPGSTLEDAILSIYEIDRCRETLEVDSSGDEVRRLFQDLMSVADVAHKLLRVRKHRDFEQLVPHLAKLNTGTPVLARKASYNDADSRKLLELTIASIAMDLGDNLSMDDPDSSKGDNPDVIITIGSRRWGFACKVPQTRSPKTLFDNMVKGVDQIEKSEAEIGVVVLGLRDVIEREKYWPIDDSGHALCFKDPQDAVQQLRNETRVLWDKVRLSEDVDPQSLVDLFCSPRSINGFATYSFASASTLKHGRPTPTQLACIGVAQCLEVSEEHCRVLKSVNKAAQWGD